MRMRSQRDRRKTKGKGNGAKHDPEIGQCGPARNGPGSLRQAHAYRPVERNFSIRYGPDLTGG